MKTEDFVFSNAKAAVVALGYNEFVATECANHALLRWRRNQFKHATDFVDFAVQYAKKHYKTGKD